MSRKVKEVIRAAELRDELTFTSFRHGGLTESTDTILSDAETRAQGVGQGAPKVRKADPSSRSNPASENGRQSEQKMVRIQNEQRYAIQNA